MPRVCGCVSLWMTVNLWGRTFGSRGVTLDCGTMTECEEHVQRGTVCEMLCPAALWLRVWGHV